LGLAVIATMNIQVGPHPLLSAKQEGQFASLARGGDRAARDTMVLCNLRLVFSVAKQYGVRCQDDLFQVGVLGLIKAIEVFDPDRGRFSTCAVWWIRQQIRRFLKHHINTVRLPEYLVDSISHWEETRSRLYGELERQPSEMEVWSEMPRRGSFANVAKALQALRSGASKPDSRCEGKPEDSPIEILIREEWVARCRQMVGNLEPRTARLVRGRFGLDGEPKTLAALGEQEGLSRERVRQLVEEGLAALRFRI